MLSLLSGELRPSMVEALRRCRARLRTAIVTNNFLVGDAAAGEGRRSGPMAAVLDHVDVLVESSRVGLRKPTRPSTGSSVTSWASSRSRRCSSTTSG